MPDVFLFVGSLMHGTDGHGAGSVTCSLDAEYVGVVCVLLGAVPCDETEQTSITCPGAVFLENVLGSRRAVILGSVMMVVGLLLVPLATSILHIAAAVILLFGPGSGILVILGKALVARHSGGHFALAYGIGYSGNGVALLVFAPLTQLFLDTYGWRGATLLLAGICMHSVAFSTLVQDAPSQYNRLPDNTDIAEHENGDTPTRSCCFRLYDAFDLHILTEFNFFIAVVCFAGVTFSYFSWMIYYIPHLEAKGFQPQVAASLCIAAAIGYLFGSVIWSPIIDRGLVKCSTAMMITSLLLTLSFVVDPWVNGVWGIAAITFLFGLSVSAYYMLQGTLTKELFPPCRLTSAFGWSRTGEAVPVILSGFVPGWAYDAFGSYDLTFIVIGITPTLCLLPMIVGILQKRL